MLEDETCRDDLRGGRQLPNNRNTQHMPSPIPGKKWQFESRVERGTARGYPGFGGYHKVKTGDAGGPLAVLSTPIRRIQKDECQIGSRGEKNWSRERFWREADAVIPAEWSH
jgi:hypothetical protein